MPEDWFQCVAPAALLLSKMPASAWSCSHNHIASCAIEHYFFGISWNSQKFAVHRLAVLDQFLKTATHVGILSAMNFGRSHNNFLRSAGIGCATGAQMLAWSLAERRRTFIEPGDGQ